MRYCSLLLSLFLAAPAAAATLDSRITAAEGWTTWQVPLVADAGEPCCYENLRRNGSASRRGCDLDERGWNISDNGAAAPPDGGGLAVYAHVKGGKIDRIRAYAASCPVRSATPLLQLDAVTGEASVAWLATQARHTAAGRDFADEGMAALAYHAAPQATAALQSLAGPGQPHKQRETALFWTGQARGAAGADLVARVAREDADADIRSHAVFVLSQSPEHDTYPRVLAIAADDRSAEVRGQALFWLAQMKDARASSDILAALRRERDASVREQAVFALSQLPDGQADAALIGLVRSDEPREVKQKALFWLGQSGSDAALAFLDEVLH